MIPRGTTPNIGFKFRSVPTDSISVAYLTLKQGDITIEKDLSQAEVTEGQVTWILSQEETLSLSPVSNMQIQCRWKLTDGTAGVSPMYNVPPYDILKEGEI